MAKRSPIKIACCRCGRRFSLLYVIRNQAVCPLCRYGRCWKEDLRRFAERWFGDQFGHIGGIGVIRPGGGTGGTGGGWPLDRAPPHRGEA